MPHRTNTELNLSVLQRYLPNIRFIISIAANAVVYAFTPATQNWEKSGVEGTLFVCEQEPVVVGSEVLPRACVFVLNRKGLGNVIVDLAQVSECEVASELLIFKMEDGPAGSEEEDVDEEEDDEEGEEDDEGGEEDEEKEAVEDDAKVIGLWIHADRDDTQQMNASIVQEAWRKIRASLDAMAGTPAANAVSSAVAARGDSVGPAMQATGRRASLRDLFGPGGETGAGTEI